MTTAEVLFGVFFRRTGLIPAMRDVTISMIYSINFVAYSALARTT